jgi:hypothetical protein
MAIKSFALFCLLQATKAAVFDSEMTTMQCFSATTDDTATKVYNGQYCLDKGSWTGGQCCDNTATPTAGKCFETPQYDSVTPKHLTE